ncbi:MAG TPA: hypothetical protein VII82_08580 [Polyangiaceae bacterium]|jgi:hypothetical protein
MTAKAGREGPAGRAILLRAAITTVTAVFLACGSSSSGSGTATGALDCALLTGDNCWKTVTSAASACLPAGDAQGTLSSDSKTCTYADRAVVTFSNGEILATSAGSFPNFTVSATGKSCFAYTAHTNGATFTTPAGAISLDQPSSNVESMTCPDGSSYSGNIADLMACKTSTPGVDLGESVANGMGTMMGTLTFSLHGTTGASGETVVFTCATPGQ